MPSQDRAPVKDVDLEPMSMNMKEEDHCVVNHGEDVTTIDFGSDVSLAEKEGAGIAGSWCGTGKTRQNGWSISCHWTMKERIEAPDLERDGPRSLRQQMSERVIAAERDSQQRKMVVLANEGCGCRQQKGEQSQEEHERTSSSYQR
ncbi:hypothetical protein BHE74_00038182 [Ensete ventricosum]|nr:hypothetical protein BHE74_00038182 [Ensete ventricosum]